MARRPDSADLAGDPSALQRFSLPQPGGIPVPAEQQSAQSGRSDEILQGELFAEVQSADGGELQQPFAAREVAQPSPAVPRNAQKVVRSPLTPLRDLAALDSQDVDVTVMAYAQWLTDVKRQAANTNHRQRAELDHLQEDVRCTASDLSAFKRQVSELRRAMGGASGISDLEVVAPTSTVTNAAEEAEARRAAVQQEMGSLPTDVKELQGQVAKVSKEVEISQDDLRNVLSQVEAMQGHTSAMMRQLSEAAEQMRTDVAAWRHADLETMNGWKQDRELMGHAISKLSQDFGDHQKFSKVWNDKLQSDVYRIEETLRARDDAHTRLNSKLAGVQEALCQMGSDLILTKQRQLGDISSTSPVPLRQDTFEMQGLQSQSSTAPGRRPYRPAAPSAAGAGERTPARPTTQPLASGTGSAGRLSLLPSQLPSASGPRTEPSSLRS
eukprot:TRINITY_DN62421_c0_g1_i2.p1 TRINITY_DN62421_c0_g1~~TRINITY_DN62421_c0_g1_i2.p1  ORF type:complete len:440 (+),score=94.35 TRINITY_DN62421_c0_g1_i2:60-1379(+)